MVLKLTRFILGRSIQRHGRLHTTSVPSNALKVQRAHKRISKDERRAIVESYVNNYRENHAGKFPSPSNAKNEVGGGYYVVRRIIQELEHKSKLLNGGMTPKIGTQYGPQAAIVDDVEDGHFDLVGCRNNLVEVNGKVSSHECPDRSEDSKLKGAQVDHSPARKSDDQPHNNVAACEDAQAQRGYSNFVAGDIDLHKFDTEIVSDSWLDKDKNDQKKQAEFEDLMHAQGQKHEEVSYHPCPEKPEDGKLKVAHVDQDSPALTREIDDLSLKDVETCEDAKAQHGYSDFDTAESDLHKVDTKIVSDSGLIKEGDAQVDQDSPVLTSEIDDQYLKHLETCENAKAQHGYSDFDAAESDLHKVDAKIVSDSGHNKEKESQVDHDSPVLTREIDDQSLKHVETCEDAKPQHGYSDFDAAESDLHKVDTKIVSDSGLNKEKIVQEHSEFEDLMHAEGQKGHEEGLKDTRDRATRQTNDRELPRISTLWENLKSIADGIINIWRK